MTFRQSEHSSGRSGPVRSDWVIAALLALAVLALYVRTLAPDVVDADGAEFQLAAWNFSFVHPTGYPLYLILGGLFQHLVPLGNPAYRLNLFTAITAALAVAMLYLALREGNRGRFAPVLAALAFAVTRTFWFDANAAEAYDLAAFFIAGLIFLAWRWQARPNLRAFAVLCFACGLALTHHRLILLWFPGLVLFLFMVARRAGLTIHWPRLRAVALLSAVCLLFPLLLYLYIPLRAPASPYATLALAPGRELVLYDNSPAGLANYILGRRFESELRWDATSAARLAAVPGSMIDQFGLVGVVLGLAGLAVMVRRKDWERLALLLAGFVFTVLFASIYHIGDIAHYYLPAYLVWAIWMGVTVDAAFAAIREPRWKMLASVGLVLVVPAAMLYSNYAISDRSGETQAREQWTRILALPLAPPENAILVSNDRDEMMPLWYIQYVENTRRDLLGLFPLVTPAPEYANIVRLLNSVLDSGRPVYLSKPMPGLEIKYRLAEGGSPLVRVLGRVPSAPQFSTVQISTGAPPLAGRVRVAGYDLAREGNTLQIAIYWQARERLDRNYATFVHILNVRGGKVAQGNDHLIGGDFYPTSMWEIGETARDAQTVVLSPSVEPGRYRIVAGMYSQADGEPLGEPVDVGTIQIP